MTVTFNSEPVLEDFLDSLAKQEGSDFWLYAVDNASHDRTLETLASEGRTKIEVLANEQNLGVAEGNNQGIAAGLAAGAEWILLLNNDTVFGASFIADLVQQATENDLKIVSPLIAGVEPPECVWYVSGHAKPWIGYLGKHESQGRPLTDFKTGRLIPVKYAPTCALLVHRDVFAEVGLMDPVYFVYFDDVDFCVRARRAGFRYWVTTAVTMTHKASTLTGGAESPFSVRYMSRNWPLAATRLGNPLTTTIALVYIRVWMLARLLLRRDSRATYCARRDGYREGRALTHAPPPPFPLLVAETSS